MKIPYDTSRLKAAWQVPAERDSPSTACPRSERIWEAVAGELGPAETAEMVEHIAVCAACGEAWRLARELAPKASGEEAPATGGRQARWVPLAASLVLAAGLAWQLGSGSREEPVERGTAIGVESLVRDGAALPRGSFTLAWKPGPPGTLYDLALTTVDLEMVDQVRDLTQPRYRVPASQLEALPKYSKLLWRVEMELPDGRQVASPAFMVQLE